MNPCAADPNRDGKLLAKRSDSDLTDRSAGSSGESRTDALACSGGLRPSPMGRVSTLFLKVKNPVRFSAGARQGEADGHRCQLAGLGGELDGPAVGVDYPLGNAQAQPAAFHLAVVAGVAAKKALALMSVLTMDSFCVD